METWITNEELAGKLASHMQQELGKFTEGKRCLRSGQYDEAAACFEEISEKLTHVNSDLIPDKIKSECAMLLALTFFMKGKTCMAKEQFDEAHVCFKSALEKCLTAKVTIE